MPLKIRRCEMYNYTVPTKPFTFFSTKQTFNIRPENRNGTSENIVQSISGKACQKLYAGSSDEFSSRFNNYRCAHRNFQKTSLAIAISCLFCRR